MTRGDDEIDERLLAYLRRELQEPSLAYAEAPVRLHGGFESSVYGLRLSGAPAQFSGPLILRVLGGYADPQRARLESLLQNTVAEMGYPAPRVVMALTATDVLGGQFMLMERMPGRIMTEGFEGLGRGRGVGELLRLFLRAPRLLAEMPQVLAEAQARLHQLSPEPLLRALAAEGLAADPFTFDGRLDWIRLTLEQPALAGLRPGLDWLIEHRPRTPDRPVICHCDFHPFNVLTVNGVVSGVIDWSNATLAEPAMDVGASKANFVTVQMAVPWFLRGLASAVQRSAARRYYRAYLLYRKLEPEAVRYYEVFRCVVNLTWTGDGIIHQRSSLGAFGSGAGMNKLIAYVRSRAGVTLRFAPG